MDGIKGKGGRGGKRTDEHGLHETNAIHGKLDRIDGPGPIGAVVDGRGDEFSAVEAVVDATEFARADLFLLVLTVAIGVAGEEIDCEDG